MAKMIRVGSEIVRGSNVIVERVVCDPDSQPCASCLEARAGGAGHWHLQALYFGKRFSTMLLVAEIDDARSATSQDHEEAKRYTDRFNRQDIE